jgi:hypothetical protein
MNPPSPSSIRDALQGQTIEGFDPAQFESLGGKLYYSLGSAMNQVDIHTMVQTFQAAHLPSLGQFIPQTGEFVTASVADTRAALVTPVNNEVFRVDAISVQNLTLGSLTGTIMLQSGLAPPSPKVVTLASVSIGAGTTHHFDLPNPIYLDSNAVLTVVASGATLDYTAFVYKVVQ